MRPAMVRLRLRGTKVLPEVLQAVVHFIEARFLQKFTRLSVPPKSVVKFVESTSTISPGRCSFGGIHSKQLNFSFPAAVKGCGRSRSIGWRASRCTDLLSFSVIAECGRWGRKLRVGTFLR